MRLNAVEQPTPSSSPRQRRSAFELQHSTASRLRGQCTAEHAGARSRCMYRCQFRSRLYMCLCRLWRAYCLRTELAPQRQQFRSTWPTLQFSPDRNTKRYHARASRKSKRARLAMYTTFPAASCFRGGLQITTACGEAAAAKPISSAMTASAGACTLMLRVRLPTNAANICRVHYS